MINIDDNYSIYFKKETASFSLLINIETKAQNTRELYNEHSNQESGGAPRHLN